MRPHLSLRFTIKTCRLFLCPLLYMISAAIFFWNGTALAAASSDSKGPIPSFVNFYHALANAIGIDTHFAPLFSGALALAVLALIGRRYKNYVDKCLQENIAPTGQFSLETITEVIAGFVHTLGKDLFHKADSPHTALVAALFFFILITNLSGLIPFLPPASGEFSANLGVALTHAALLIRYRNHLRSHNLVCSFVLSAHT